MHASLLVKSFLYAHEHSQRSCKFPTVVCRKVLFRMMKIVLLSSIINDFLKSSLSLANVFHFSWRLLSRDSDFVASRRTIISILEAIPPICTFYCDPHVGINLILCDKQFDLVNHLWLRISNRLGMIKNLKNLEKIQRKILRSQNCSNTPCWFLDWWLQLPSPPRTTAFFMRISWRSPNNRTLSNIDLRASASYHRQSPTQPPTSHISLCILNQIPMLGLHDMFSLSTYKMELIGLL